MVLYKKSRVYIALNRTVLHSINSEISPFSAFGKQRGCLKYAVVNPAVSNNLYFALSFDFQVHLHLLQKKKYFDFFFQLETIRQVLNEQVTIQVTIRVCIHEIEL